jgi:hypothetical protein
MNALKNTRNVARYSRPGAKRRQQYRFVVSKNRPEICLFGTLFFIITLLFFAGNIGNKVIKQETLINTNGKLLVVGSRDVGELKCCPVETTITSSTNNLATEPRNLFKKTFKSIVFFCGKNVFFYCFCCEIDHGTF